MHTVPYLALVAVLALAQGKPAADPLGVARQAYNDQRYDAAIASATEARRIPATALPAAVVFARAHLERFRQSGETADLSDAREALKTIDATKLGPRDQVEFLIALGESLYLDDQDTLDDRFAAAAELFEQALARAGELELRDRDRLFEWWAQSLDQQAQQAPPAARAQVYDRIVKRAAEDLARPEPTVAASYWLAAASRGAEDPQRAWGAAVAGWTRAASLGARGVGLRNDLDKLMLLVILPERARQLTPGGDPRPALILLEAQWTEFKKKWDR